MKRFKKVTSALVLGLVLTVGITTMVGAKTIDSKQKTSARMSYYMAVEPGEVPVSK